MQGPKQVILSVIFPSNDTYITGSEVSSPHAVLGFAKKMDDNCEGVLDLATMQFGSGGRGKGGEFFTLDNMDGWYDFIECVASGLEPTKIGSLRIGPHPWPGGDKWLKGCAKRVKERWEKREKDHWCSQCGVPGVEKHCPCQEAWYCSASHQTMAWKYHKKFCTGKKKRS